MKLLMHGFKVSRIHYNKHNIIHNMKYYIYKTQRFEIQSKKEVHGI